MSEKSTNKKLLDRVCRECGTNFKGGPRAWYCPSCRDERIKNQSRAFKARKRAGNVVPLGSVIKCPDCGKEIIKMSGPHVRCEECSAKHLKQIDHEQSKDWKEKNHEKYLEAKRDFSKRRHQQEETKKSGIVGINWDKGHKKWRVVCYDPSTKKQKRVGYADDIETAKQMLDNYRNKAIRT